MRLALLISGFVLTLIASFLLAGEVIESMVGMDGSFEEGLAYLRNMGPWAGVAIAALLIADVLLPVPATPLFTALGALYGTIVGGAIGAAASIVAGLAAYGLTRLLGERGARWLLGDRDLGRLRRFLDRAGTPTVIASRWLPILPETVACLAGLAPMPFGRFMLALTIGTVPMTFAFAAIGAGLADRPATAMAVALALSALLWPVAVWAQARSDRQPPSDLYCPPPHAAVVDRTLALHTGPAPGQTGIASVDCPSLTTTDGRSVHYPSYFSPEEPPSMKVVCDRSALLDALTLAAGVVPSRAANPALQCVRLAAKDGKLAVSATDQEISIHLMLGQVNVEDDGETLVPADKLVQIVRASDDGTLTLESSNRAMDIRGADAHFKIFGYDPREAPAVREPKGLTLQGEIPAGLLRRLVSRTVFAASVEQLRYAIAGVLFDRQGRKLRLVATDGKRLAVARGECGTAPDGEHRMIVPNKAMQALIRLVDDPDANVRISADANQARFEIGDGDEMSTLTTNLVEGTFPPFEDVIPKDNDKKISIDSDELTSAVRRAALLTTQESRGVRMTFANDGLTLSSRAPEMGEAEIHIDLPDYQGETIDIAFNPGYLVDALKVLDGGPVIVELKTSSKPGVLRAGADFTYVFMPITLD